MFFWIPTPTTVIYICTCIYILYTVLFLLYFNFQFKEFNDRSDHLAWPVFIPGLVTQVFSYSSNLHYFNVSSKKATIPGAKTLSNREALTSLLFVFLVPVIKSLIDERHTYMLKRIYLASISITWFILCLSPLDKKPVKTCNSSHKL